MSFRLNSLGLKLNLALLLFFLVVGFATALFLFFGFEKTKESATSRSREGLEELGQRQIRTIASDQATLGVLQMEWASDAGQMAARYLAETFRVSGGSPAQPVALTRNPDGILYDPSLQRSSDILMPNFVELTPAALADVQESAALDAIAPAIFTGYTGRIRGEGFDATSFFYSTVNQVHRYYPSIGLQNIAPPDIDISERLRELGPELNPERRTVWTEPYEDRAGQGRVVTAYAPVYDGDVFKGYIGIDLSIVNLIAVVNGVQPTPSSFGFYIDRGGNLLRTDAYDLLAFELESQENEELAGTVARMKAGENGVDRVTIAGKGFFIGYSPVREVGGSFAVAAPVSEITEQAAAITAEIETQADQTMTIVLTSMAVLFVFALVGATYLNRRVFLRPIEALVAGTRAVAAGDFETRIPVRGDDELAALGHSFNQMTSEILVRAESLRQEVGERQAAQEQLRALFAAMTDWVIVLDREGRIVRLPDTNAPRLNLDPSELPGTMLQVPPELTERILASINRALGEHTTVTDEYPYVVGDRNYWFSSAFSPISEDEVVLVARDITDRINASQELERQVEERTRELRALLDVSANVTSTLELGPLLTLIIQQIGRVVDHWRASLFLVQDGGLYMVDSRVNEGGATTDEGISGRRVLSFSELQPLWDDLYSGRSVILDDVRDGSEMAKVYQKATAGRDPEVFGRTRSFLVVPLVNKQQTIGMLTVSHEQAAYYTADHARLLTAIAGQAAIAVENARLYEQVQARSQELQTLLSVSRNVASTLELRPLLDTIIEQLPAIVEFNRCSIFELHGGRMDILDSRANFTAMSLDMSFSVAELGEIWERMSRGESVVIDDVHGDSVEAQAYRRAAGERMDTYPFQVSHSALGVPLTSKDRIIGMLVLSHMQPSHFTEHHASLVQAVATQIAIAIDNARLYEQAQQLAAVEERQRLARELHDSVSQALYGIALGARTARTLIDRDAAKAADPVDYVLSLAEAGLAEMRALIFELRPESLEIEGLVAALDKQIAATAARYGIEVASELAEEPEMTLANKEIFYRIGQEALHNVVKHAHASRATVRLARDNGSYVLEVGDDGVGFDAQQSFPGHMGLISMSERAATIGAQFEVDSAPGRGTRIRLCLAAG